MYYLVADALDCRIRGRGIHVVVLRSSVIPFEEFHHEFRALRQRGVAHFATSDMVDALPSAGSRRAEKPAGCNASKSHLRVERFLLDCVHYRALENRDVVGNVRFKVIHLVDNLVSRINGERGEEHTIEVVVVAQPLTAEPLQFVLEGQFAHLGVVHLVSRIHYEVRHNGRKAVTLLPNHSDALEECVCKFCVCHNLNFQFFVPVGRVELPNGKYAHISAFQSMV